MDRKRLWEVGSAGVLLLLVLALAAGGAAYFQRRRRAAPLEWELRVRIMAGDAGAVRALLARGVSPDSRDGEGTTALQYAVGARNPEVARALLAAGAHPDLCGPHREAPLLQVTSYPDESTGLEVARLLLDAGADPNALLPEPAALSVGGFDYHPADQTALMRAIIQRQDRLALLLLERGADVNARDSEQRAALHWWALVRPHDRTARELGRRLLRAGADVHARDQDGKTPLDHAVRASDLEMIGILRQ